MSAPVPPGRSHSARILVVTGGRFQRSRSRKRLHGGNDSGCNPVTLIMHAAVDAGLVEKITARKPFRPSRARCLALLDPLDATAERERERNV